MMKRWMFCLLFAACGGSVSDKEPQPEEGAVTLRGACASESRFGSFVVEAQEAYSFVDGKAADGVVPVSVLEEVLRVGDCALMRKRNYHCDPPCAAGWTCGSTCVPYPAQQDLGTVSVSGLKQQVEMKPMSPGYTYFDTSLPHPAYEPGAIIRLRSTTGYFGELVLNGIGVEPLVGISERWVIAPGRPLNVEWVAGTLSQMSVQLRVNIDQHGNTPTQLVCDVMDTGSATIPAALIDALIAAGISGYPNGSIARRSVDAQAIGEGCIELVVVSPRSASVSVGGHVPCSKPEDCPSPQTCDVATNTCR